MAKKATALVPTVVDDTLEQEVAIVLEDSTIVQRFAEGLKTFFRTAAALEVKAKGNLAAAKLLKLPTTKDEDETLQKTIKSYGADKKDALEHWEITQKVSRFHKRLTSARSRAEEPNDEAVKLATSLHNQYVENDRRRVAAENERLRREAEQRAADDRAREVAEMERKALEAEEQSADLSTREMKFVVEFVMSRGSESGRSIHAAGVAGYKNAREAAARLLGLVKIRKAIEAREAATAIREQAAAVKEAPLDVQFTPATREVSTAVGTDRNTHSAELLDERLLIEAIVGGRHGIPLDILTVKPAKLNEYARSLHELLNKWPGVRYKKTTSLV